MTTQGIKLDKNQLHLILTRIDTKSIRIDKSLQIQLPKCQTMIKTAGRENPMSH